MSTQATVTMIAPDGSTGDVPVANVPAARQAGGKVAVQMKSPQGDLGWVPAESVHDAAVKGATMVPMNVPDAAKVSYWDALTNPVGSGGQKQGILGGIEQVGGQAIKTMVQPFMHPIDTLESMAKTGLALYPATMPFVPKSWNPVTPIVQNYQNDKATGGTPLALENLAGQALGTVEAGRMAPAVVKAAAPVLNRILPAVGNVAGRAALLGRTPEEAYQGALKPSTTLSPAERAGIVQTGLQNEIPVSPAGVEKLSNLVQDLNDKIKDTVASDPNRPIDPNAVAARADAIKPKFSNQVNAQPDLNAIEASKQQFLEEQGAKPGTPAIPPRPLGVLDARGNPVMSQGTPATPPQPAPAMGVADAQAMKQGTYRVLAGKYGEQGSATVEAQKALARGLKEEIAAQFPEINGLNAAESKLLDLQPVLERAVNRISNRQGVGIGTPIVGTAATAMTGSAPAGIVASVMKSVLDNPNVTSRLAIAVSKAQKISPAAAMSKVQAYSSTLGAYSAATAQNSGGDNSTQAAPPAPPQ